MNDYKGSVAQQNVNIITDIVQTAVVGGNFYQNILYVTSRFSSFGSNTPEYPVVTKEDYADIIDAYAYFSDAEKAIIKSNLASLFEYSNVTVYIIPNGELPNYKYKGYFTYVDLAWNTVEEGASDYVFAQSSVDLLQALKVAGVDKNFTQLLCDVAVDITKVKGSSVATTQATVALLTAYTLDFAAFARAAMPTGTAGSSNAFLDANGAAIGYSPALYELGRCLGMLNGSGTPVGNAFDMDAIAFQNVLPDANTDTTQIEGVSPSFATLFDTLHLNYFKPVGNGTGQLTNFGGWTLLNKCIGAQWMVAYMNFMNRVACATVITSGGRSVKSVKTYNTLLEAIKGIARQMIKTERLSNYTLTAPSYADLPPTNGHTITIPNAWNGVYLDNVRDVNISGTMTVAG